VAGEKLFSRSAIIVVVLFALVILYYIKLISFAYIYIHIFFTRDFLCVSSPKVSQCARHAPENWVKKIYTKIINKTLRIYYYSFLLCLCYYFIKLFIRNSFELYSRVQHSGRKKWSLTGLIIPLYVYYMYTNTVKIYIIIQKGADIKLRSLFISF
jgi:hypothetical protein